MTIPHLTEGVVKHVLDNCLLQRTPTSADRCGPHLLKAPRKIYTAMTTEVTSYCCGMEKEGMKESLTFYSVSLPWLSTCQKANIFAVNTVKPNRQK